MFEGIKNFKGSSIKIKQKYKNHIGLDCILRDLHIALGLIYDLY